MGNSACSTFDQQAIDELVKSTSFSEGNVRDLYRHFRRICASCQGSANNNNNNTNNHKGFMGRYIFEELFEETFFGRNTTVFSHHVFRTLDNQRHGYIDFKTFITGLDVHVNGTDIEKSKWCFQLLDVNGNGSVSRKKALDVIQSYYDLHARFIPLESVVSPDMYRNMIFKQAHRENKDTMDQKSFLLAARLSNTVRLLVQTLSMAAAEPYHQRRRRTASFENTRMRRVTVSENTEPRIPTETHDRRRTVSL